MSDKRKSEEIKNREQVDNQRKTVHDEKHPELY